MSLQRILLVEDDVATREHLQAMLEPITCFDLIAAVGTVAEGQRVLDEGRIDILLTDLGLPDGSGIELIEAATGRGDILSLVVTVFGDERHVVQAIEAGAMGYLLKDEPGPNIEKALRDMLEGGSPISPMIARYLLRTMRAEGAGPDEDNAKSGAGVPEAPDIPKLSAREHEVLRHIVKGFTYAEISEILGLSPHTVSTHVRKIYRKLAVHSRGEAVYEAMQLGIVQPHD